VNERDRALQILRRIDRESLFAAPRLAGESGFVRTIVLGVLRWRSRLDFAMETLAERRVSKIDPIVVEILRIGIYQLGFMEVAPHAAVSESVDLAARHAKRARGFVNAILRRAAEKIPEPRDPATRLAHPGWLYERWEKEYGSDRAEQIAAANQELSYPDVLMLGEEMPAGATPSALVEGVVKMSGSTADLDRTRFYPMDEGSAVIAAIAAAAGGEVLDLAAAPGGKTLYLQRRGVSVVSNDVSLARLRPLIGRTPRLVVSDGRAVPFRRRFPTVLLDAPCSATGTIRKNPELKWRLRPEQITALNDLQRALLQSALSIAGETVVYATCSLEREENDAIVESAGNGFVAEDITRFAPPGVHRWIEDGVLRLTPDSGTDGFTAFVLKRSR
jgi:16S rRNA (cytosine967-C5)-methyltransferase